MGGTNDTGCCSGPGKAALAKHEEAFGRKPQPMPVAGYGDIRADRISEWTEPGATLDGPDPWFCGTECSKTAVACQKSVDAPGTTWKPASKNSAYLVADTPDGHCLMSTERGDGGGVMWLNDQLGDDGAGPPPVWDPNVRNQFRTKKAPKVGRPKDGSSLT